jgi:hypothetical protein
MDSKTGLYVLEILHDFLLKEFEYPSLLLKKMCRQKAVKDKARDLIFAIHKKRGFRGGCLHEFAGLKADWVPDLMKDYEKDPDQRVRELVKKYFKKRAAKGEST